MAQDWLSDQVLNFFNSKVGGLASAGVAGAAGIFNRATEDRGLIKVIKFNVELATPNNPPNVSGSSIGNGDTLILAELKPTDRIFFGRVYEVASWGTSVTISFGKRDSNDSTKTSATRYLAASAFDAAAGTSYDFNLNMGEQVGTDPVGDQTAGQLLPTFGSGPIYLTGTVGGATPNSTGSLNGYILVTEEGN